MFWKCISDGNNKAMWDPEGPDFKECLENSNIFTQEGTDQFFFTI